MNDLQIITHNNERVLTTSRLAEQYETAEKAIKQNFNNNKDRYIEGKHYYCLTGAALRAFKSEVENFDFAANLNKLYLWTEKGALLHAKSLNTDKAWQVYEFLVDNYFNPKQKEQPLTDKQSKTIETEEYHYFDKTYQGEPVITLADFEHITGIEASNVRYRLKSVCKQGTDYLFLKNAKLIDFKVENPNVKKGIGSMYLLKKTGVKKLLTWFKSGAEMPKCFIETNKNDKAKKKETGNITTELRKTSKDDFITAINVLRNIIYASKVYKKDYEDESDPHGMALSYQKDIDACTQAIMRICSFLSIGYGTDF